MTDMKKNNFIKGMPIPHTDLNYSINSRKGYFFPNNLFELKKKTAIHLINIANLDEKNNLFFNNLGIRSSLQFVERLVYR